jgi:hypothetical protein
VRDKCKKAGVPFFFKQWGGVRKAVAGRKLDGKTYDEFPKRVAHPVLGVAESLSLASKFESDFKKTEIHHISTLGASALQLVPS